MNEQGSGSLPPDDNQSTQNSEKQSLLTFLKKTDKVISGIKNIIEYLKFNENLHKPIKLTTGVGALGSLAALIFAPPVAITAAAIGLGSRQVQSLPVLTETHVNRVFCRKKGFKIFNIMHMITKYF